MVLNVVVHNMLRLLQECVRASIRVIIITDGRCNQTGVKRIQSVSKSETLHG